MVCDCKKVTTGELKISTKPTEEQIIDLLIAIKNELEEINRRTREMRSEMYWRGGGE